jgi:hypothetical protein
MGSQADAVAESTHDSQGAALQTALSTLLGELVDGASATACWILNPNDPGLLRSLDTLDAPAASATPGGRPSIAAHVDHLCYGLELLNRWSKGENSFADADYSASWRRVAVSEQEWATLRGRLRAAAQHWLAAVERPRSLSDVELTGMLASVAHLAYHLGAIRQVDRAIRGPAARD